MAQIQHPSSLNPWQQYRQACSILKNTSRATNPAWYQQGLDQDLQLHIRPDGPRVFTAYYFRKTDQWSPGPKLDDEILQNEEAMLTVAQEVFGKAKSDRVSSIGVVVHVANEFATAELNPELDNPGALADLRKQAVDNPTGILEDTTVSADENSFRIIPYAATGSDAIGTTITITRQLDTALNAFRKVGNDNNFPIITQTLSAPLIAIMGLPAILTEQPQKPFVAILQYPWFTVLAFFNEHADLKLIRTLQHRGLRQAANFRNALFTTSASLEFMDPDLFIVPLGEEIDRDLQRNLSMNFPNSKVQVLEVPRAQGIAEWAPELILANKPVDSEAAVSSLTFTSFREDKWALQDFLPMNRKDAEIYPEKGEMSMLRIARWIRMFIMVVAFAGLGYFGQDMWSLMNQPEWSFDPGAASTSQAKLSQLNIEQRRINHWSNLLQDRSKTWVEMEFLARMFPENGHMLLKEAKFTAKPDSGQGQNTVGFVKVWKVTGFARDEAIDYLNQLNTRNGINSHFDKIAQITGNDAYRTDIGNRNITVNVRTRENNSFRPVEDAVLTDTTTYPFAFDLTITQRFEATDPMAINVRKAP